MSAHRDLDQPSYDEDEMAEILSLWLHPLGDLVEAEVGEAGSG